MFNKILVAFDPTEPDMALIGEATTLALCTKATLIFFGVLTADGDGTFSIDPRGQNYEYHLFQRRYQEYQNRSVELLRSLTKSAIAQGISAEFAYSSGSPGREICKVAKSEQVDLILVGSHGRSGLEETMLRSVSNYVMHHAPCSVMVRHPQQLAKVNAEVTVDAANRIAAIEIESDIEAAARTAAKGKSIDWEPGVFNSP